MSKSTARHLQRTLRIAQWVMATLVCAVFAWLGYTYVAPNGTMTIHYRANYQGPPPQLQTFASKEKALLTGKVGENEYFHALTVDPVYFSVATPWHWDSATVSVKYKNPDGQPLVRLGALRGSGAYSFTTLATYDPTLETLPSYWVPLQDGDVTLWQKNSKAYAEYSKQYDQLFREEGGFSSSLSDEERSDLQKKVIRELQKLDLSALLATPPRYASIDDFLTNLPATERIVQFQYDLSQYLRIPSYAARSSRTVLTKGLRGSHTIVAYVGAKENLDFIFSLAEVNRHADDDRILVTVRKGNKTLLTATLKDDDDHLASNTVRQDPQYALSLDHPGEGVYTIDLQTTDDTFITQISSQQYLYYFEGHVYLADNEEYRAVFPEKTFSATDLFTDGATLQARTSHEASKQDLGVGSRVLHVQVLHDFVTAKNLTGVTAVSVPQNDMYLAGGSFAFRSEQLFRRSMPMPVALETLKNGVDGYDAIIARYKTNELENGEFVATATVPSGSLEKTDGRYNFILNVPGLSEHHRHLDLFELDVTLNRTPLTLSNVFPRLQRLLQKIHRP